MDEATLRDINHISHRDGGREAGLAGVLVFVLGLIAVLALDLSSSVRFMAIFGALALAGGVAFAVKRTIARWATKSRKEDPETTRRNAAAETARRIEEARASGDFDRFGGAGA